MPPKNVLKTKLKKYEAILEEDFEEEKKEDETVLFKDGKIKLSSTGNNIFTPEQWLFLGDNDGEEKYSGRNALSDRNTHWGQLKLFIEELLTICYFADANVQKIVYVGAMEGTHIALLAEMFPSLHFDLYDKEGMGGEGRKFDPLLRKLKNVSIYNKYFEDEDCEKYLKENKNPSRMLNHKTNILFFSDIRRVDMSNLKHNDWEEAEKLVWDDMELQQHWVEKMVPYCSSLKFRLPYAFDFVLNEGRTRKYLNGLVMRQVFASKTSSEFRLITMGETLSSSLTSEEERGKRDWDIISYERKCAYHNYYTRRANFVNIFDGTKEAYSEENNINLDYDNTVFMFSIKSYLMAAGMDPEEITNERAVQLALHIIKFIGKGRKDLFSASEKDD